jgi:F0F1-type ATP synthase membrane subunit a
VSLGMNAVTFSMKGHWPSTYVCICVQHGTNDMMGVQNTRINPLFYCLFVMSLFIYVRNVVGVKPDCFTESAED